MNSKGQIKKVGNIFPSKYETGEVLNPSGICKALKSGVRDAVRTQVPKILVDSNKQIKSALIHSRGLEMRKDGVSHSLKGAGGGTSKNFVVSGPMKSTNTAARSTGRTSEAKSSSKVTSVQSTLTPSPTSTFSPLDFLARASALQERGWDFRTLVERYSTRFSELQKLKDPKCSSLKTLRGSYQHQLSSAQESISQLKEKERENLQKICEESKANPIEAGKKLRSLLGKATASQKSSTPWKNWAIGGSTKFLTASISGSRRIGNASSLSDILQEQVDEKYFLSSKLVESLMKHKERHEAKGNGFGANIIACQEASGSEGADSKKT